jgi:hypothetical protein
MALIEGFCVQNYRALRYVTLDKFSSPRQSPSFAKLASK